jgi:hypothetical protein
MTPPNTLSVVDDLLFDYEEPIPLFLEPNTYKPPAFVSELVSGYFDWGLGGSYWLDYLVYYYY